MKNYKPRQTLVVTGRRDSFEFWMVRALEEGGKYGALPAELCRLCGISSRTARLWCDPRLSTFNKAFCDAFEYALTLSEAYWEGVGRLGVFGALPTFKERAFQFIVERSFGRTKGNVAEALTTREFHDAITTSKDGVGEEVTIELGQNGVPDTPIDAYRWLVGEG